MAKKQQGPVITSALATRRNFSSALQNLWNITSVRSALDAHDRGDFSSSAPLSYSLMRDPRILAACTQRVGAVLGLDIESEPADASAQAATVRDKALAMLDHAMPASTQAWMLRNARCMLGVAVLQVEWTSFDRPTVTPWPMEHVYRDEVANTWMVRTASGQLAITPGDGQWIVYEPDGFRGWLSAPIRALSMAWADRTYAIRDRSRRSESIGLSTFIGTLPEGVRATSPDASGFKTLLQSLQNGRGGLVKPSGYTVESIEMDSKGHEVFDSMIASANEDIALAILGQTGTSTTTAGLGQGGNRVHDGVRYDLIEADVETLWECIGAQLVRPWAVLNYGRAELAPEVSRCVPDAEEDAAFLSRGARIQAFVDAVNGLLSIGVEPDIQHLAAQMGVPFV